MNKTLFEEPYTPDYISEKAQDYFNRFEPRPGENVEHFQARLLKYSISRGDGQQGKPPEVRLSRVESTYSHESTMDIEQPGTTQARPEINEKHIHISKPDPEPFNPSDLDSVFYAELDKISQEYKYVVNVHLYQQLVRPLIVSLCSAHESIIHRLSTAIRERINHDTSDASIELSLEDIVGDSFFDKAKKYFEQVLKCPFDLTPAINQGLKDLGAIRNVIVHQHSWIDKGKNKELFSRIENGHIQGATLRYGELVIRIDYAVSAVNLIMEHLEKLIAIVKERYTMAHGREEKRIGLYYKHNQAPSELNATRHTLTSLLPEKQLRK